MTEQAPEIVAAADVSPVSPKPIHTAATSPALVPSLQDRADTLDVAYLDSLTTAPFPFVTMRATPATDPSANAGGQEQSSLVSDTIVVRGDGSSDGSQDENEDIDEESLDAYGEEDNDEQDDAEAADLPSGQVQHEAESGNGLETETTAPQSGVSEASSESMINTPSNTSSPATADLVKSESPAALASPPAVPQTVAGPTESQPTGSPNANEASNPEPQIKGEASDLSAAAAATPTSAVHSQDGSDKVDIQKLVDDITAKAIASSSAAATSQALPEATTSSTAPATSSMTLPQSSSLPPKPVIPQQAGQPGARPEDFHPFQSRGPNSTHAPPPIPMQGVSHSKTTYLSATGAPGTTADGVSSLPPPPPPQTFSGATDGYASLPNVLSMPSSSNTQREALLGAQLQQAWETFEADEKRYMTEAKWERFPDKSRIFIGNLSSERVSKREVFDLFHRFGRLAQISLKSAYGFVQYHSAQDAEAAMQSAQGAELGGRKIHLEFSRVQKKRDLQDRPPERDQRERSRERRNQRGGVVGRGGTDRYDGRDSGRRGRDDYRPGRSPSPRREDGSGRDRHRHDPYDRASRVRSRSPQRFGRYEPDSYRRRSPSPRRRGPVEPALDMPQRYGEQVPDVQLLVLQEVHREFVGWVQQAFYERGLKSDVMFFNPRFSRDAVLQKLVVEGVHGVIELDMRAQTSAKIPLQVFDRSAGNNVRFDQYQDLDPKVAAELVLRTKQLRGAPQPALQPAYAGYAPPQYPQYPQAYPPPHAAPTGYPYAPVPAPAPTPPAPAALSVQDIAGMAGHIDNNTLQALLASLSANQSAAGMQPQQHPQVDINALLGSINSAAGASAGQPPAGAYGAPAGYAPQMAPNAGPMLPGGPGGSGGDTAQQVQNIMATLARHR